MRTKQVSNTKDDHEKSKCRNIHRPDDFKHLAICRLTCTDEDIKMSWCGDISEQSRKRLNLHRTSARTLIETSANENSHTSLWETAADGNRHIMIVLENGIKTFNKSPAVRHLAEIGGLGWLFSFLVKLVKKMREKEIQNHFESLTYR